MEYNNTRPISNHVREHVGSARGSSSNNNRMSSNAYNNYSGSDAIIRVRKKRRKPHKVLHGVLIALAVLLVLVAGAVAYGAWYASSLASNMAMDQQQENELNSVLVAADDTQAQPFYILLVGSDNWEADGERSDAMMLTRVDPVKHDITLVSIPRDTPYLLNGNKTKINQAFAEGGATGAVTAVHELTGVPISYYVEIEFAGLADFVDSMGGIYVDVPHTIDYQVYTKDQDVIHIEAGNQLLNGEQCVALARMRTAYDDDQDAVRQSNVRAMVISLLKNVLQSAPTEIPGLVQNLSTCVSTNIDLHTMIVLATDFSRADSTNLYTCTGPYRGGIDPDTKLWLCYDNPDGWTQLMEVVDSGQDPSTTADEINKPTSDTASSSTVIAGTKEDVGSGSAGSDSPTSPA